MRRAAWIVLVLTGLLLVGCDESQPRSAPTVQGSSAQTARPTGPPYPPVDTRLSNTHCLVHPNLKAQLAFSAMHEGKRYGFCCEGCKQMFLQEPSRYLAHIE